VHASSSLALSFQWLLLFSLCHQWLAVRNFRLWNGFQLDLAHMVVVWVVIAEKVYKVRGQRSRSYWGREIFLYDAVSLYLVEGFPWNLQQTVIMWVGKGFQYQRSKVKGLERPVNCCSRRLHFDGVMSRLTCRNFYLTSLEIYFLDVKDDEWWLMKTGCPDCLRQSVHFYTPSPTSVLHQPTAIV